MRHILLFTEHKVEESKTPGEKYKGRHIPKKYLTKKSKAMKKEIDTFRGKKVYKKDWEADYDRRSGKRIKTKKSKSTIAYHKMFGESIKDLTVTDDLNPHEYKSTNYSINNTEIEIKFVSKKRRDLAFNVYKTRDGRITRIENPKQVIFPYKVGQILNRNVEIWACNNGFYIDGVDTCPEEKIFGIKKSDIPAGHELRNIFSNKFRK